MNRILINTVFRASRMNPTYQSVTTPYRWSSNATNPPKPQKGSLFLAGAAGGLVALLGGFGWYHFSGTRQVVNTAQGTINMAQETKTKVAENSSDAAEATMNYLRSVTTNLLPNSASTINKVFDEMEKFGRENQDDIKKVMNDTYKDFENLTEKGKLDQETAEKALNILQQRVKELQGVAGHAFNKYLNENPQLKEKVSESYNLFKDTVERVKQKKPEVENLLKETSGELVKIFTEGGITDKTVKQAQELLKKKIEEVKKVGEQVTKDLKK